MLKKFSIKLPSNIKCIYCKTRNLVFLIGPSGSIKKFKCKFKLDFFVDSNNIFITDEFFYVQSKKIQRKKKLFRGLELSYFKNLIKQLVEFNYKRLNLVGVGYRAFLSSKSNTLNLKLGYSHQIYIKIPETINIICPKPNTIFISGPSFDEINNLVSLIRSLRVPDPYKGKGVLYEYESLNLKEGKSSKT